MDFICPKCGGPLETVGENTKKCSLGHSFDRAKEGYYNLLLGSSGGTHGDNAEMVNARREFLSYGYYTPLCDVLSSMVIENTSPFECVLDAGLGEGYYTDAVERALREYDGGSCVMGFDISKDAVKRAAKRNPNISLAVASSYSMPIADGSVDTVMNVFAPLATSEVLRVLRKGGRFIMAYAGEEHLFGLKSAIYDEPYKNETHDKEIDGFRLISSSRIRYTIELESAERVRSLFKMTPYAYRTGKEEMERLLSLDRLSTEVDFYVNCYEKI